MLDWLTFFSCSQVFWFIQDSHSVRENSCHFMIFANFIDIEKSLKESAIHRNRWYNLKDYILERICKQRNCLKSIYSINYRYLKFTKFTLEFAWGSRHVFTPVTSLTLIDFLVGLPCARSVCVLTKLAVHLYWNFDLISEKNSSSVW